MYFHAKNSTKFYRLAKIHPNLQTLLLPSEMMLNREKPIRMRIGRPITVKTIAEQEDLDELGEFLKRKVYMMKSYYERRKSLPDILKLPNLSIKFPLLKNSNVIQNIIEETPQEDLKKEIEYL